MSLKLYYDLMSQPSRSLYLLLKYSKANFEPVLVDLRKLEHYSDEFTKLNRLQRVPVIEHNGFVLTESVAIIKYLARENIIPETLYPKESKAQARVDEFLEWQHIGLRLHTSMFFRYMYLDPIITGKRPDPKTGEGYERRMQNALEDLDTKWLGRGTDYLIGNTPTVADVFAASELEQPKIIGFDARDKYPNIAKWWNKVVDYFNPHYQEAHVVVNKIQQKLAQKKAKL